MNVNRCAVTKIIKCFEENESVKTAHRTGRPCQPSQKLDRRFVRLCKRNRFDTATEIKNQLHLEDISSRTVSRR